MRKFVIALLTISLAMPVAANAVVVKAGSKCSKVGATVTSGGKIFTCIKKSGKLVWNSGVPIKKSDALVAGVCPTKLAADKVEIAKSRANTLISMAESDSIVCADKLGWQWRIGQRDDEEFALTMDYRADRVTVTVRNGLVTAVIVG